MSKMTFKEAANTVLTFGEYINKRVDDVAVSDEGLLYLDYLSGVVRTPHIKEALDVYLSDAVIQKELYNLVRGERTW